MSSMIVLPSSSHVQVPAVGGFAHPIVLSAERSTLSTSVTQSPPQLKVSSPDAKYPHFSSMHYPKG